MEVLKQISPTHVLVAPKDSPSKYRPSSRAMSVRTSLRSIVVRTKFSNRWKPEADTPCLVILSESLQRNGKHEARLSNISVFPPLAPPDYYSEKPRFCCEDMPLALQRKTRIEFSIRVLNVTPPMPFRRITRSLSVTGG